MVTSILHRATGIVLAVGALVFACGLLQLAAGPDAWTRFVDCVRSPLGFLFLFGWSWAASYHLINGIRHLIQDAGYGFKVDNFVRSSWISIVGSLLLTVIIWLIVIYGGGAA